MIIPTVRDLAIILLAVESIVVGILLIILILEVRSLARLLQTEIKPLLTSVNETAATIKGTTAFLSDNVAGPVIRMASVAAGVGRAIRTLRRSDGAGRQPGAEG
jgi:hypothetical protein